jgi:hypothetical protein
VTGSIGAEVTLERVRVRKTSQHSQDRPNHIQVEKPLRGARLRCSSSPAGTEIFALVLTGSVLASLTNAYSAQALAAQACQRGLENLQSWLTVWPRLVPVLRTHVPNNLRSLAVGRFALRVVDICISSNGHRPDSGRAARMHGGLEHRHIPLVPQVRGRLDRPYRPAALPPARVLTALGACCRAPVWAQRALTAACAGCASATLHPSRPLSHCAHHPSRQRAAAALRAGSRLHPSCTRTHARTRAPNLTDSSTSTCTCLLALRHTYKALHRACTHMHSQNASAHTARALCMCVCGSLACRLGDWVTLNESVNVSAGVSLNSR